MNVEATLKERGERYGDFGDHAEIAQKLQDVMRGRDKEYVTGQRPGWAKLSYIQRQALTVIADKIARILSGDPDYVDNWHDIQGYARLVEERLPVVELIVLPPREVWHEWNPHAVDADLGPHRGLVLSARLRCGEVIKHAEIGNWGVVMEDSAREIVEYRLVDDL